jgi:hypothetical protein
MARSRTSRSSASLYDFRDLDLMHKLAEGGSDGMTSAELAESAGLDEDSAQAMVVRSSWMRRFGFFEFDEKRRLWRLSGSGERIIESHVKASTLSALEEVPDEAFVDVMAHVTSRYRHGDPITATLLRREFLYGTKRRNGTR